MLYLPDERFGERRRHAEESAGRDAKERGSGTTRQSRRDHDGGRDHAQERTGDDDPMRKRGAFVAAGRRGLHQKDCERRAEHDRARPFRTLQPGAAPTAGEDKRDEQTTDEERLHDEQTSEGERRSLETERADVVEHPEHPTWRSGEPGDKTDADTPAGRHRLRDLMFERIAQPEHRGRREGEHHG